MHINLLLEIVLPGSTLRIANPKKHPAPRRETGEFCTVTVRRFGRFISWERTTRTPEQEAAWLAWQTSFDAEWEEVSTQNRNLYGTRD